MKEEPIQQVQRAEALQQAARYSKLPFVSFKEWDLFLANLDNLGWQLVRRDGDSAYP